MPKTTILIGHRRSPENTNTRFMINRLSQKRDFLRIKFHQIEEKDSHLVVGHRSHEEYAKSLVGDSNIVIFDCSDEESLSPRNIDLINLMKKQEGVKLAVSLDVGQVPNMERVARIKDAVADALRGVHIITYSHDSQFSNGVIALVSEGVNTHY